jgi:hypothetical protein
MFAVFAVLAGLTVFFTVAGGNFDAAVFLLGLAVAYFKKGKGDKQGDNA